MTPQALLNTGRHLAMEIQSNKTFIYLCTPATPSLSAYLTQLTFYFFVSLLITCSDCHCFSFLSSLFSVSSPFPSSTRLIPYG